MAFLKDKDREALRKEFQTLGQPIQLVVFTQTQDCEYCDTTKALLEEVAGLSDKITVETHDVQGEPELAAQFRIDKTPAIAIVNGKDYGIRYYGIPSGYEFGSLVDDIVDVSKGESGLSATTKAALTKLTQPVHLQVFVTPTCPYCPQSVRLAHKLAMESELVRADMIEASEFPELSEKYQVMAVPRTIINETHYFEGALPEAQVLAAVFQTLESKN